ncbi:MAG: sulfite exporter TauE/SafE family protein [Thermoleophilia bacterium]
MPACEYILLYIAIGATAGVLAGLLGVGGGLVIVPALAFTLEAQGVDPALALKLALGTSLATIIFTSVSSAAAHSRRGAVDWRTVMAFSPGVVSGTLLGSFAASRAASGFLTIFFAAFLIIVCLELLFWVTPRPSRELPGRPALAVAGAGIGGISSLVGIGGGIMTVPYLLWHNVRIHRAIGTSAAVGFPIAAAGAAGYLLSGWANSGLPDHSAGFIYLPALAGIAVASTFFAPLGAILAHRLPVALLKRVIAVVLLLVAARMAAGVI